MGVGGFAVTWRVAFVSDVCWVLVSEQMDAWECGSDAVCACVPLGLLDLQTAAAAF